MKTETKEVKLIAVVPDDGKYFVNRKDRVVTDGKVYLPSEDAASVWEEMDEADALAIKQQWRDEAEAARKKRIEEFESRARNRGARSNGGAGASDEAVADPSAPSV